MKDKIINFSNSNDPRTGFLSNESKHSFILEDKKWLTVEHYFHSKKFEGTLYEDEIRLAPSIFILKKLILPKTHIYYDEFGNRMIDSYFGNKNNKYYIKDNFNTIEKKILKEAIHAKFNQNPFLQKKLLETRNSILIDLNNPLTGDILMEYRESLKNKFLIRKKNEVVIFNLMKDIHENDYSGDIVTLVQDFIHILINISEMEGWNKIMDEMIEDVILIIVNSPLKKSAIDHLKEFSQMDTHVLFYSLPHTNDLILKIENLLFDSLSDKNTEKEISDIALYISSFIKWVLIEINADQRNIIFKKSHDLASHPENIKLPKVKRWYRQLQPPDVTPGRWDDHDREIEKLKVCLLVLKGKLNDKDPKYYSVKNIKNIVHREKGFIVSSDDDFQEYINSFSSFKKSGTEQENIKNIVVYLYNNNDKITSFELGIYIKDILGKNIDGDRIENLLNNLTKKKSTKNPIKKPSEKKEKPKKPKKQQVKPKKDIIQDEDIPEDKEKGTDQDGDQDEDIILEDEDGDQDIEDVGQEEEGTLQDEDEEPKVKPKKVKVYTKNNITEHKDGRITLRGPDLSNVFLTLNKSYPDRTYKIKDKNTIIFTTPLSEDIKNLIFNELDDYDKIIFRIKEIVKSKIEKYLESTYIILKLKKENKDRIELRDISFCIEKIYKCKIPDEYNKGIGKVNIFVYISKFIKDNGYILTSDALTYLNEFSNKLINLFFVIIKNQNIETYKAFNKIQNGINDTVEKEDVGNFDKDDTENLVISKFNGIYTTLSNKYTKISDKEKIQMMFATINLMSRYDFELIKSVYDDFNDDFNDDDLEYYCKNNGILDYYNKYKSIGTSLPFINDEKYVILFCIILCKLKVKVLSDPSFKSTLKLI